TPSKPDACRASSSRLRQWSVESARPYPIDRASAAKFYPARGVFKALTHDNSAAEPAPAALSYGNRRLNRSGSMRPQEGTYLAHRQWNPLFGLLPREHAHLGFRREHRGLHGDGVGMSRDVIGEDQYGCLAIAHKIACHGPDEVGIGAIHLGQKF